MNLENIQCFVFDFGFTLSSQHYFTVCPPECPEWIEHFQHHIFSGESSVFDRWMEGVIDAEDVAGMMAPIVGMSDRDVLAYMKRGCLNLSTNSAVARLADASRRMGKHTILVTGNIDLFDSVIVPDLDLTSKFDVIINSSRSRSVLKQELWDEAFELLGEGVSYPNSFLIEDSRKNVELFRAAGGQAHHYRDDETLVAFLDDIGFPLEEK